MINNITTAATQTASTYNNVVEVRFKMQSAKQRAEDFKRRF